MGSRIDGDTERPRAVGEYLVERMLLGGATRIAVVVSPGKWDILTYFGGDVAGTPLCYCVQPRPAGLCDAIFRVCPFVHADEYVIVGLPDTIWFPEDALATLPGDELAFLLFPVEHPERFDAVETGPGGQVRSIQVKCADAASGWVWGAFRMPGHVLHALHDLWLARERRDEYIGTLVNAFLASGGRAVGVRGGEAYVDVGTLHGYREALELLSERRHALQEAAAILTAAGAQPAGAPPTGARLAARGGT